MWENKPVLIWNVDLNLTRLKYKLALLLNENRLTNNTLESVKGNDLSKLEVLILRCSV